MITLENICKNYFGEPVLSNINTTFDNTGLVLIVGESGSGKSTLLNIISGSLNDYTGNLLIDNKNIKNFSKEELLYYKSSYISYIRQDNPFLNDLNMLDNLMLIAKISNKNVEKEEIIGLLKKFKLDENLLKHLPTELSGGQLKRFQFVQAFLKKSKVIIADEAEDGLDEENKNIIAKCLEEASKDILIISATHEKEIYTQYDKIINLENDDIDDEIKESLNPFEPKKMKGVNPLFALKLGLKYTKRQIIKLGLSIILLLITLCSFMVFLNFLFYTPNTYIKHHNIQNEISSVAFESPYDNRIKNNQYYDELKNNGVAVMATYADSFSIYYNEKTNYIKADNIVYITDDIVKMFDFKIDDRLPNPGEILISKSILLKFNVNDYNELEVNGPIPYKIVGVISDERLDNIIFMNVIDNDPYSEDIIRGLRFILNDYNKLGSLEDARFVDSTLYAFFSPKLEHLIGYVKTRNLFLKLSLVIAIVFLLLSLFILIEFISSNVKNKKDEINKIRNFGGKEINVATIFAVSPAILSIISYVLALILSFVIIYLFNEQIKGSDLLIPNFFAYLITIILIAFIVTLSLIVALKVKRKNARN